MIRQKRRAGVAPARRGGSPAAVRRRVLRVGGLVLTATAYVLRHLPWTHGRPPVAGASHRGDGPRLGAGHRLAPAAAAAHDRRVDRGARAVPAGHGARPAEAAPAPAQRGMSVA